MAILTIAGRAKMAELIMSCPAHLALGLGGSGWGGEAPEEDFYTTALEAEIGRKAVFRKLYVVPDDDGAIILPGDRRFAAATAPTRHIYFQFMFDYGDGVGGAIREIGLFLGTQPKAGLPAGQTWFTPDQLDDPGSLLLLAHPADPDTFNPQKKGTYENVFTV